MKPLPDVIDAKFKVISPKRRWRLGFDWRNFLIVGGMTAIAGLSQLLGKH